MKNQQQNYENKFLFENINLKTYSGDISKLYESVYLGKYDVNTSIINDVSFNILPFKEEFLIKKAFFKQVNLNDIEGLLDNLIESKKFGYNSLKFTLGPKIILSEDKNLKPFTINIIKSIKNTRNNYKVNNLLKLTLMNIDDLIINLQKYKFNYLKFDQERVNYPDKKIYINPKVIYYTSISGI